MGLGNPGPEYENSRHNIGFRVIDLWCRDLGLLLNRRRFRAKHIRLAFRGKNIILLCPLTFMNLSGNAIRYWLNKEKLSIENLLVVVDDLALPFGTLRLRAKGGDAGHNGLNHIQTIMGTTNYARLRFGVGNDFYPGQQVDYVLSGWTDEQEKALPDRIEMAGEIIKSFGVIGLQRTMNVYNNK